MRNNNRKIAGKLPAAWRVYNIFLNNTWVKKSQENRKYFKLNENENKSYQNLWGSPYREVL